MVKPVDYKAARAKALASPAAKAAYDEAMREYDLHMEMLELLESMKEKSGMTSAQVAAKMGVTPSAVSKLEKAPERAGIATIKRYAAACGVALRFQIAGV